MQINDIQSQRLRKAFAALPQAARDDIQNNDAMVLKSDPYYSKGRLSASVITSAGSPAVSTITVPPQDLYLFNYAKGDSMAGAGFPTGVGYDKALDCDTNLYSKSETNGSEYVFIDGLSIILTPTSDFRLVQLLSPHIYVGLTVSGIDNFIRFGNVLWLGGGGGISGGGRSLLDQPRLDDYQALGEGFPTLGIPSVNDVKELPDPIVWGPKGKVDSSVSLRVSLQRTVTVTATARGDTVASNRVTPYLPPANQANATDTPGTYVEFYALFRCVQIAPRSNLR